ncbi:MAG: ATP-binding protein [Elusimicrobiota bacterium]
MYACVMQSKNKEYIRNLNPLLRGVIQKKQSILILGPRQVGKTTLVKRLLMTEANSITYSLQIPEIRLAFEKDPSLLIRQVKAAKPHPVVFIDEAQKVPELFDAVQYLIDEKLATFIITGSSARKLKRKGGNLLPGRLKNSRLDPLMWNEFGWLESAGVEELRIKNASDKTGYTFEKSLIFGALPGIVNQKDDVERADFLKAYSQTYLEEEIRAEALSRKIGAFSRFLELAAQDSGTAPNFAKLSMESGVSAPTIKEFYNVLDETLVAERVDAYLKNARKRIMRTARYYLFDLGVRNSLARLPLMPELINSQKGVLFEHAVMLEIIRRVRSLGRNYRVCYWRTSSGLEVDCVIDTGAGAIPIEIKASAHVRLADLSGLAAFLNEYPKQARQGFVVAQVAKPEKLSHNITVLPWRGF